MFAALKDNAMSMFNLKTALGVLAVAAAVTAPQAAIITYTPPDADMNDLDHYYAYKWGINASALAGQTITGATLFIDNIRDWTIESNDVLYVRLINTAPVGINQYYDDQASGDYFGSQGIKIATWNDLLPYTQAELNNKTSIDLTYNFTAAQLATLMSYSADGNFGITFDPDCHYYNDGIKLTITTAQAVPEPGTFALLGLGLLGLVFLGRKRKIA